VGTSVRVVEGIRPFRPRRLVWRGPRLVAPGRLRVAEARVERARPL